MSENNDKSHHKNNNEIDKKIKEENNNDLCSKCSATTCSSVTRKNFEWLEKLSMKSKSGCTKCSKEDIESKSEDLNESSKTKSQKKEELEENTERCCSESCKQNNSQEGCQDKQMTNQDQPSENSSEDEIEKLYIKIMKRSGCDRKTAIAVYEKAGKNINNAVDMAKKEYRSTLPVITQYKNGIQVEHEGKETFYEISSEQGAYLYDCLERGEFDREVLGLTSDFVDVVFIDLKKEKKHIPHVYTSHVAATTKTDTVNNLIDDYGSVLPPLIQFDEKYDVCFKLCYKNHITVCKIHKDTKLKSVYQYFKNFFKKEVGLFKHGEKLEEDVVGSDLKQRGIVVLYLKKE